MQPGPGLRIKECMVYVRPEDTKNENLLIKLMFFKTNATLEIDRTCTLNGPTIMDKSPRTFLHL